MSRRRLLRGIRLIEPEERGFDGLGSLEGVVRLGTQEIRVPHLPTPDRPALAVKVQERRAVLEEWRPVRRLGLARPHVAQQIQHHHRR